MSFKAGPLGCVIQEDWTLESDENIAKASGQSPFFGANPNTASFVGRWNELKSRGVKAVFLWEGYEKIRSLVPHHQLSGTCVARGFHQATQHSLYNALSRGNVQGDRSLEIAWEPFYIGSRVYVGKSQINGEGSSGAWAGQWAAGINGVGGVCPRQHYKTIDLTISNEPWAVKNSYRGGTLPADVLAECQKHKCDVHRVRNNAEIADAIASRFGVARCWDTLFGDRDANGFSKPADTGSHCQAVIGVFLMRDGRTGFVEQQSWGPDMPRGPRTLRYSGGEVMLPIGTYAVSEDNYLRAQQSRWWEAHCLSIKAGQEFR